MLLERERATLLARTHKKENTMANGYTLFSKLHPAGGLYRYKAPPARASISDAVWKSGKYYLLVRWASPAGISTKSPLLNAFFLVGGQERCVDISFFRYLEQVE
jgi:hypothetical protein